MTYSLLKHSKYFFSSYYDAYNEFSEIKFRLVPEQIILS